jgi:hypothetical protein
MRSARGWDNLSQSFAWGPRQSSSDRLRSRPINFASRTTSLCQLQILWDRIRNQSQLKMLRSVLPHPTV